MIKENAITDRNVDKDDWRHPDNIKAVVNELNTKGTMIVYANYTINADEFAVHVHSFGAWESGDAENHIRRCSCGETEKAKHEWESKTENGVVTFTCKVCQATRTEVVSGDATHHLFRHIAKAATCTEEGNKEYWECVDKNCGKYFSDSGAKNEITDRNSVKIPATGNHTWDTGKVTKPATCKDAGVKTFTCTRCKTTKTETIAKTGHKWDDGKVTKEPTYVLEGAKEYTCTVCRETKVEVLDKKQAIISSEEEFKKAFEEAMNEEAKTLRVKLTSDLNLAKTNCLPPDEYFQNHLPFGSATLEIDLNGHTLYCKDNSSYFFLYLVKGSKLVLKNGIVDGFPFEIEANAEVYLENITLKNAGFVLDLAGYEAGENNEIPESNPPAILELNNCKAIYGEKEFDITKVNFGAECCDTRSGFEFRARIFVNGEKAPVNGNTFEY